MREEGLGNGVQEGRASLMLNSHAMGDVNEKKMEGCSHPWGVGVRWLGWGNNMYGKRRKRNLLSAFTAADTN